MDGLKNGRYNWNPTDGVVNAAYEAENNNIVLERIPNGVKNKISISNAARSPTSFTQIPGDNGDNKPDPAPPDRAQWNNGIEFLLSCIAMSVGIGNFIRFPFVAYQNGGGAFLIPYLIVLFFIGKPMYFLELSVGQFCGYGQVKCWEMSPFFKGVGYASALCNFCVVTYYCSLMALTVYYFFASFAETLPWAVCEPRWTGEEVCNILANETLGNATKINLPELYFEKEVLQQKADIVDGIGFPEWRLSLCLLASWIVVFLAIVRGVQSSGKVAYFTAIYPYVILAILLITACFKEGAWTGIKYFITPQWERIYDPQVWYKAVSQCFFSLGTATGPIIMYASYNPFRHNIYRDAMIISLTDTFTSLLAGLTVFSILGNLAWQLDKDISQVVSGGLGLTFVSYADAISKFNFVPQLYSGLFFLMLFTLGVGSLMSCQMALITVVCDQFPKFSKFWVTSVTCVLGFLFGLVYVTPGGQFIVALVDYYGGDFTIYVIGTLECVGICWFYGLENICKDIEFMLNIKLNRYWRICWGFLIPVVLSVILVYALATAGTLEVKGVPLPRIAIACGRILATVCLLFIPAGAIYAIYKSKGTLIEKINNALRPTVLWGPRLAHDREDWENFKAK